MVSRVPISLFPSSQPVLRLCPSASGKGCWQAPSKSEVGGGGG